MTPTANVAHGEAGSCHTYCCSRLNEPEYEPPLRTESDMIKVSLLQQHPQKTFAIAETAIRLLQSTAVLSCINVVLSSGDPRSAGA